MLDKGRHVTQDVARAISLFERGCTMATEVYSCMFLAERYLEGRDVPRDVARGAELLEKVCLASTTMPTTCVNAGQLYRGAPGVPPDETRALGLFRRACQMGDKEGCELAKP
jgi:TPR repeat protein